MGLVELEIEFGSNEGVKLQIRSTGSLLNYFSNSRCLFGNFWTAG
jgi:hypothetical protein